ncbi:MAG: cell division protein ZapE [Acidimicrobiales bacterium]
MIADRLPPLSERTPTQSAEEMVAAMTPPSRWLNQNFENFHPLAEFPSQLEVVDRLQHLARQIESSIPPAHRSKAGLLRRGRKVQAVEELGSVYLDGGFGVGKTHLLVALFNAVEVPKAYLSFSDLTAFVGVVGFDVARRFLSARRLVAIDEFELDDPGDTVLVANLCRSLIDGGVHIATTSNTLPDRLGVGRFAAEDFQREIGQLRSSFEVLHLEGSDFRQRNFDVGLSSPFDAATVRELAQRAGGECIEFSELNALLARVHPALYRALLEGVRFLGITHLRTFNDQYQALRFVSFVDRLYDCGVSTLLEGCTLGELYPPSFLGGGFRMKYGRSLSRLVAITTEGRELVDTE